MPLNRARTLTVLVAIIAILLLAYPALVPPRSSAAPNLYEVDAIPLVISGTIGNVTSIQPFEGDDLLVSTQQGIIYRLERPLQLGEPWVAREYYSLADRVQLSGEAGLLDIAPAPDFPASPYLYFSYVNIDNELTIERYNTVTAAYNAVLSIPPAPDTENGPYYHYGGAVEFQDGLLYVTIGDRYIWYPPVPGHPSQGLDTLYGKLLRIDVTTGNPLTYTIPADNPYVDVAGARPEIWARGFRNPWKLGFDPLSGDAWISDVGSTDWEEVNLMAAGSSGLNFGWRCFEGNTPYPYVAPECAGLEHTRPLHVYGHGEYQGRYQCAVTGGLMYRGELYPNLEGMYLYADYCASRIWGLRQVDGEWINYHLVDLDEWTFPTALATDAAGNIYVGVDSGIFEIRDSAPPGATPIPTATPANDHYMPLIRRGGPP